jgi:PAS domain S-box-containing protein
MKTLSSTNTKEIFFEMAADMACVAGFDGYFKQLNHIWEEVLGYTIQELMDKPYLDFVHPADQARTLACLGEVTWGKPVMTFENRYLCKNGAVKWFSWRIKADRDSQLMYACARDITNEKQTQVALKESESRMKALIRYVPIAIAMLDDQLRFLEVNDQFQQEFGLKEGHLLGNPFSEAFPHLAEQWKAIFKKCLSGAVVRKQQFSYPTAAGGNAQYVLDLRPWFGEGNQPGGIVCVIENITLQRIAQDEVTRKSQQLNGILKYMPVVVYLINNEGMLVRAMGAGLKAMGVKDVHLEGKPANILLGEENFVVADVLEGKKNYLISHGRNGEYEWVYEHYLFPDNVRNNGVIGFAMDITGKKKSERDLQLAKESAEKANHHKSRFLANMSHEIRTPLNAIIGFAEVLQKHEAQPVQREYLEYITSSGKLLLKLIGDVLDLSKIEEGKLQLSCESFHFRDVISSAISPYKYRANEKGLNFSVSFDDHLPAYVFGDSHKLNQVVINLIGNALKFTREGNISVHFSCLNNPHQAGEAVVRVSIADTGLGVPTEQQSQIFETFTQADSSIVRQYGGSGLGLSIARELVQLMGGEIHITSPSNVPAFIGGPGSTFWFLLRLKVDPTGASKVDLGPTSGNRERFDGVRVLVAEDNLLNQKLINIFLTGVGCEVEFAGNGQEAIWILKQRSFDMVFMDVQMPIMDGYTTTRQIRAELGLQIPIIGLTANVYKEDIEHCMRAGMSDFLGKPYHEAQLYQKLFQWTKVSTPASVSAQETSPLQSVVLEEKQSNEYIDLSFFKKLAGNSHLEMKGLIHLYLDTQEEFLRIFPEARNEKRWQEVGKAVHKFKPSLQMVSHQALDITFQNLEDYCQKGQNLEKIPALIDQAVQMCEQIRRELIEELARFTH